jgi:hypothetical protein
MKLIYYKDANILIKIFIKRKKLFRKSHSILQNVVRLWEYSCYELSLFPFVTHKKKEKLKRYHFIILLLSNHADENKSKKCFYKKTYYVFLVGFPVTHKVLNERHF